MEYRIFGSKAVLRLDKGDKITESILALAEKENIRLASLSGIGATDNAQVGIFSLEKSDYDRLTITGNHEITSLAGNINTMNGKPYCHLHITMAGPDGSICGGHLFEAVISLTAEIFIDIADGTVDRKRDNELQINKLSF